MTRKSKRPNGAKPKRKQSAKARAASLRNLKHARGAGRRGKRPKKAGKVKTMARSKRGGRAPKKKRRGAGFRFSLVGTARKVAKMSAPIDALANAADNIAAGDWAGGLRDGFAHLSSDLTGIDVVNHEARPQDLIWGYGPAVTVEVINGGLHFLKSITRGFGGRASPAL